MPNQITQIYLCNLITIERKTIDSSYSDYKKTIAQLYAYWYATNNKILLSQNLKIEITK